MNGAYLKILSRKLLVHQHLRQLPGAMDVIGAEMKDHPLSIVSTCFDAIGGQFATDLVACNNSQSAEGQCA